jgi:L-ascorbate metabolism protein UlaG (beta-lactamase superfamily)
MKLIKKIMLTTLVIILVLFVAVYAFIQQPEFGRAPSGARLELIKKSPHYRDGSFQNLSLTPDLTEGVSYFSVMKDFIFSEKLRNKPTDTIPSVKTDLKHLDPQQDVIIWFGHSSYFMQIDGKKFLVDPVLSGAASPVAFTTRSFIGTDVYTPDDFPEIDYLLISHDHWDHLDYKTILALKPKVGKVITGLGTGEHFEYWGFDKNMVIEKDWNEQIELGEGFTIYTAPARHFSGRTFARNRAIWTSFVLIAPHYKLYIGGDSGYDTHFAEIGKKFGTFDLAILENGQYDKSWKYIHMLPDEVLKAAKDLNAKRLFPVHSSKFALGNHSWDEPLRKITELNQSLGIPLITPVIGQPVLLKDSTQTFKKWWEGLN